MAVLVPGPVWEEALVLEPYWMVVLRPCWKVELVLGPCWKAALVLGPEWKVALELGPGWKEATGLESESNEALGPDRNLWSRSMCSLERPLRRLLAKSK
jgi:hypothetical protein